MYAHVNDKYSQRKKKQNSERRNRTEQVQENKKTRNEDGWKIKHIQVSTNNSGDMDKISVTRGILT